MSIYMSEDEAILLREENARLTAELATTKAELEQAQKTIERQRSALIGARDQATMFGSFAVAGECDGLGRRWMAGIISIAQRGLGADHA